MKIVKLNPAQFDKYSKTHKYRNYFQSTMYANVMKKFGYDISYLGIVNEYNKLIGATLIMYKEVFMKNKIAYAPRGILFDYDRLDNIKELVEKLKSTLGKQGFMFLRIDPYIPLSIRNTSGDIININNKGNEIINNLKKAGFTYKGKNLYFETEKPRWEALVLLNQSTEEAFARLDKRTRNKIRRAMNSGLEVIKNEDQDVNKLYEFAGKKEHRPLSFYKQMTTSFESSIDIYYAVINTEKFVINSRRSYEKELEYNDEIAEKVQDMTLDPRDRDNYLNKKMESDKLITAYKKSLMVATNLLRDNPNGIEIGGVMVIKYDNAAYIFSEGIDDEYGYLNATYLMRWQLINDYTEQGLKYLSLNAIVGDFEHQNKYSGLNESKLGFNATITEYIGEFDIVLNNFSYNLYKKFGK